MFVLISNITSISVSKGDEDIFPQTGQRVTRNEDNTNHEVILPSNVNFPFMGTIYTKLYVCNITIPFKKIHVPLR